MAERRSCTFQSCLYEQRVFDLHIMGFYHQTESIKLLLSARLDPRVCLSSSSLEAMSVLVETNIGSMTIDLFTDECPNATKNFLKLCKVGCVCFVCLPVYVSV